MTTFRSRRLEALFGTTLATLTADHIALLVDSAVGEEFDLDFKGSLYGRSDADRRALASDVAALANTAGGMLIVGVQEDSRARASSAPGVVLSDGEASRMRQIVASLVAPLPAFDISLIPKNDDEQTGFFVVCVPPSPSAPHAVLINDGLRFPKRNGSTTRYLSEPEVAFAYRSRFSSAGQQQDRRCEVESQALTRLRRDRPWVVVTLVPDVAGDLALTTESVHRFRESILNQEAWSVTPMSVRFQRADVGWRRLRADGSTSEDASRAQSSRWVSIELHADGCGSYALQVPDLRERSQSVPEIRHEATLINDESLVAAVLTGLTRLGRHAEDAAASGGCIVGTRVLSEDLKSGVAIGHVRRGFAQSRSTNVVPSIAAIGAAALDDLANPGPDLVRLAARMCDELAQGAGIPELGQLSTEGEVRHRYWSHQAWPMVEAWAASHAIPVNEGSVDG
ncbi:ATP-binding protein [Nocardioides endophyticus]|uniref:AlbA family DNA-binding domain-containing protein n=1 Tax=Nocardioides endophyticus TaxID=1353775 RepID=UPI0031EBDE23